MKEKKSERRVESLWGKIPIGLLKDNPTLNELKAYVALSSFQGQNPDCYPPIKDICQRAIISSGAVKKAIASLLRKGWVERTRRYRVSNLYRVMIEVEPLFMGQEDRPSNGPNDLAHSGPNDLADILKAHYKSTPEKEQRIAEEIFPNLDDSRQTGNSVLPFQGKGKYQKTPEEIRKIKEHQNLGSAWAAGER